MGSTRCSWLALVVLLTGCSSQFTALETNELVITPARPTSYSLSSGETLLVSDGIIYGAGGSSTGMLGYVNDGATSDLVRIDDQRVYTQVAAGYDHACALSAGGEVYCWGGNTYGQLGQGDTTSRVEPTLVTLNGTASAVFAAFDASCALVSDALYCWGYNRENAFAQTQLFVDRTSPTLVTPAFGTRFVTVAIGQGHLCGISDSGVMQCSGRNTRGELGAALAAQQSASFQQAGDATGWWAVTAGQDLACGLRGGTPGVEGELWCWGANDSGELGLGDTDDRDAPERVGDALWRSVDGETFDVCATTPTGDMYCAGRVYEGQLGTGDAPDQLEVLTPILDEVASVQVGRFHTCVVRTSGDLYCTGQNTSGELGTGDTASRREFTLVPAP